MPVRSRVQVGIDGSNVGSVAKSMKSSDSRLMRARIVWPTGRTVDKETFHRELSTKIMPVFLDGARALFASCARVISIHNIARVYDYPRRSYGNEISVSSIYFPTISG